MSERPSNIPGRSTAETPWQFSLGRLLVWITLFAITLGLASRSLSNALLFFLFSSAIMTLEGLIRRRITLLGLAIRITLILVGVALIAPGTQPARPQKSTAILALRVIDAKTKQPIPHARILLHPNGNIYRSVHGTTNEQGECRIAATFSAVSREIGWGRFKYDAILKETEIDVSAPGFETQIVFWRDISHEELRLADAPPGPPAEIFLEPQVTSETK